MTMHDPIWRPYTQHKTMTDVIEIVSGRGEFLYTADGRELLDLISSWWVNIHGHCHVAIAGAIADQAHKLEHVIFAGMNHRPASELATGLINSMGRPFERVFFSDNGSTAVEAALKMTLHEAQNRGEPDRTRIIAFEGGYHGDTWAAMAAGKTSGYFDAYQKIPAPHILHTPFPATWDSDPDVNQKETTALAELEKTLDDNAGQIASLIIEPLVQGASGMRMCSASWLADVVRITKRRGVRVIFDEVMTGFGRTGTMFAFEQLPESVRPDLVCLSKGITGGFLPLAVTVTTGEIFDAFLGDSFETAFAHGHSYTANPIACAAAVAGLKLFETESTLERFAKLKKVHCEKIRQLPGMTSHRVTGGISACEFSGIACGYGRGRSVALRKAFIDAGLLLRPLADTLYFMPPACIDPESLATAYDRAADVLGD